MPSTSARPLHGNIPAVVTPFAATGELMLDAFQELLDWYIACGVDGVCVAGDNGESWALTKEERRQLSETAVRHVAGRVPVVMGASAITTRDTIAYAELAAAAGADAILLQPQAYVLKASMAEIVGRYAAVARAVEIPIMAYNSPRRTNLNMDVRILGAVCDAAPVVALKEASRDLFHVTHVLHAFADRIAVMTGPAPFIFPTIPLGAKGFVSSGPELFGREAMRIISLAKAGPSAEAREFHYRLTVVYETLMETGTWPAALKAAIGLLGLPAGVPRDPVQTLPPDQMAKLKRVMGEIGLLPGERQRHVAE
ncbi:MAG: dihydrodipicolinate synthase family protein [Proteobacteria bacterium]|nr:dihydrodipicolinate synthase family protein [Pseudomonadota bacterium]